jgi:hypothetical protein
MSGMCKRRSPAMPQRNRRSQEKAMRIETNIMLDAASEADHYGARAIATGLGVTIAGAAVSALFVWVVLPFVLPVPAVAFLSFFLFYLGFFVSVFAGREVADAIETARTLKLAGVGRGVASRIKALLCLED